MPKTPQSKLSDFNLFRDSGAFSRTSNSSSSRLYGNKRKQGSSFLVRKGDKPFQKKLRVFGTKGGSYSQSTHRSDKRTKESSAVSQFAREIDQDFKESFTRLLNLRFAKFRPDSEFDAQNTDMLIKQSLKSIPDQEDLDQTNQDKQKADGGSPSPKKRGSNKSPGKRKRVKLRNIPPEDGLPNEIVKGDNKANEVMLPGSPLTLKQGEFSEIIRKEIQKEKNDDLNRQKRYLNFAPFSELLQKDEKLMQRFRTIEETAIGRRPAVVIPNSQKKKKRKTKTKSEVQSIRRQLWSMPKIQKQNSQQKSNKKEERKFKPGLWDKPEIYQKNRNKIAIKAPPTMKRLISDHLHINALNSGVYDQLMSERGRQESARLVTSYKKQKRTEKINYKNLTIRQPKQMVLSRLNRLKTRRSTTSLSSLRTIKAFDSSGTISIVQKEGRPFVTMKATTTRNKPKTLKRRTVSENIDNLNLLERRAAFFDECEEEEELVTKASINLQKRAAKGIMRLSLDNMGGSLDRVNSKELNYLTSVGLKSMQSDLEGAELVQQWVKSKWRKAKQDSYQLGAQHSNNKLLELSGEEFSLKKLVERKNRSQYFSFVFDKREENQRLVYKPESREGGSLLLMRVFESRDESLRKKSLSDDSSLHFVYLGGYGSNIFPDMSLYELGKILLRFCELL